MKEFLRKAGLWLYNYGEEIWKPLIMFGVSILILEGVGIYISHSAEFQREKRERQEQQYQLLLLEVRVTLLEETSPLRVGYE